MDTKSKRNDKEFCGLMFLCFLGFTNYNIISIDIHVTCLATHLNLFDGLFNNALQMELYVEVRCYT